MEPVKELGFHHDRLVILIRPVVEFDDATCPSANKADGIRVCRQ